MIETLLSLWLNENQAKIRLAVRQYRLSPASQIGTLTGMERTHAYKLLLQLQEKNLIASSLRGNTSYFYVPDKSVLRSLIEQQYRTIQKHEEQLDDLEQQLDVLIDTKHELTPPLRQWTGNAGVESWLHDIITTSIQLGIRQIVFFGSKTLESLATSEEYVGDKRKNFFKELEANHIYLDGYEGTGLLLLEHIIGDIEQSDIKKLPTGSHALQMIIVWPHLYYIFYRREPVMLKITSPEMTELMRALLQKK